MKKEKIICVDSEEEKDFLEFALEEKIITEKELKEFIL